MEFEWDEEKNQHNIRKHGFDFADVWEIFEAPMLVALDTSGPMAKIGGSELGSSATE